MPTKQETFDTVVAHLRKQKAQSINSAGCAYRGLGGRKCAVGALVPDHLYDPSMEDRSCCSPNVKSVLDKLGHDNALCEHLQKVHDMNLPTEWEERFKAVAFSQNLVYTEPANAN